MLRNLDQRLREETGLPVILAEDPLASVVLGAVVLFSGTLRTTELVEFLESGAFRVTVLTPERVSGAFLVTTVVPVRVSGAFLVTVVLLL